MFIAEKCDAYSTTPKAMQALYSELKDCLSIAEFLLNTSHAEKLGELITRLKDRKTAATSSRGGDRGAAAQTIILLQQELLNMGQNLARMQGTNEYLYDRLSKAEENYNNGRQREVKILQMQKNIDQLQDQLRYTREQANLDRQRLRAEREEQESAFYQKIIQLNQQADVLKSQHNVTAKELADVESRRKEELRKMGELHSQYMRELLAYIEIQRYNAVSAYQYLEIAKQEFDSRSQELSCALRNSYLAREGLQEKNRYLQQELNATQTGYSTQSSSEVPASETEAQAQIRSLKSQLAAANADNINRKSDMDKIKRQLRAQQEQTRQHLKQRSDLEKQIITLHSQNQYLRSVIDELQKNKEQQYVEDLKARNAYLYNENCALKAQNKARTLSESESRQKDVPLTVADDAKVKQVCLERDRALHQIYLLKEQLLEIEAFRLSQNRMFETQERRIVGSPVMAPLRLQPSRRK